MATATSLTCPSLPCVDTVCATSRTQNHMQRQNRKSEKEQRTTFVGPLTLGHVRVLAAAKPAASKAAVVSVITSSSLKNVPRRRGFVSTMALPMLVALYVILSAAHKYSLLQPAAAASVINAASPVLLLALVLSQRAGASPAPTQPSARDPLPTEKASAAVKTRWTIWRQRVSAEEQAAGNPSTGGRPETPAGGAYVPPGSVAQLGAAAPSPALNRSEALLLPVPGMDGALLMTGASSDGVMNSTPLKPGSGGPLRQGATVELIAGTPDARPTSASISPIPVSTSPPVVAAFAGPRPSNSAGLTALRAAPGAPVSRRIAPFVVAPPNAQLPSSPSAAPLQRPLPEKESNFSVGASNLGTTVSGGSTALHPLSPQLRMGALREGAAPEAPVVVVTRPPSAWLARESKEVLPNVDVAPSNTRGHVSGTPGFVYSSGGPATAENDVRFYRVTPPVHKEDDSTRQHPLAKLQEAMRQEQQQQEAADVEDRGHSIQPDPERGFSPRVLVQRKSSQQQQHAMPIQMNAQGLPWVAPESLPLGRHPQQQEGLSEQVLEPALLLPSVEPVHPNIVPLKGERKTFSEESSTTRVWPEKYLPQQQPQVYLPASAGTPFESGDDWQRRQLQQQLGKGEEAGDSTATPNQQIEGGVLVANPGKGNQEEAEALFGKGTPIQLLRSRKEFEAFVRRVVVEQQRVAVVLFFGRHCPYCMMFKGVFNEAAKVIRASLRSDTVVFAAKEVVLLEEDFIEDDEASAGGRGGTNAGRRSAEPIEATLNVNHIPQIRVVAPLVRTRQDQHVQMKTGQSPPTGGGPVENRATHTGVGEGAIEESHSPLRGGGNPGAPEVYWLPATRGRNIPRRDNPTRATTGGGEQAAAYLAEKLPQTEFSSEGILKYLVDNIVLDRSPLAPENAMITSIPSASTTTAPAPLPAHPTFPSPLSQYQRFREVPSSESVAVLRPVEKALLTLQSECKIYEAPLPQNAALRQRHEYLCSGFPRWDGEQEEYATFDVRLHDALSTLTYMLKKWVPMSRGKGDRLSREAESVLLRLLEICRVTFPWQQVKKKLFRLQVILHLQGSGAEPVYREWREPGGLQKFNLNAGTNEASEGQEGAPKHWGWWHSNVESYHEREKAAKKQSSFPSMLKKTPQNERGEDSYEARKEDHLSHLEGLPKTAWIAAVKHLQLAGIAEGDEQNPHNPRLLQCETALCGAWTLFHILAEGASATFRDQIRRAVEQASSKGGRGGPPGGDIFSGGGGGKKKDTIDLQFYTPQDNLGTYAVRRYIELLHHENGASTLASSETESTEANEATTTKGRRKLPTASNDNLKYIFDVLEDELGSLENSRALQQFEEQLERLHRRAVVPAAMLQQVLRDFIAAFFSCYSCKDHFLQCYNRGFFGAREVVYPSAVVANANAAYTAKRQAVLAATAAASGGGITEKILGFPSAMWKLVEGDRTGLTAAEVRKEKKNYLHLRLWLWRLHNAVNLRTASEATLNAITQHPDLFLSEEEWHEDARSASSRRKRDYTVLERRSLGVGYYLNVDPRWPLRENCPECRTSIKSSNLSADSDSSLGELSDVLHRKGQGFLLTAEYLHKREGEKDICIYSDYFTDLDLREIKRYLARTYWTTDRRPRELILGVDAVFDYTKRAFRMKH